MFYIGPHRIDTPYLLAPMAGVSEMPFRVLAFEFGAGLATTELISAKGLFHRNQRTLQYLTYDKEVEKPYSLQLFGGDEPAMAAAAVAAMEAGAQIIDINMGCPVKKVTKTGAGSALLCDPQRAASLLRAMRSAIGDAVPITAKIRSGWDANAINCVEMAKALEDAGCAALAMHARTRAQGYSGKADWSLIRMVKDSVRMPIIGNGDVVTVQDALDMKSQTGCDGVMIGRGALGNPWIFQALAEVSLSRPAGEGLRVRVGNSPTPEERLSVLLRHLHAHIEFHVQISGTTLTLNPSPAERERAIMRAIHSFRPHLVWYSRGLVDASHFRERIMRIDGIAAVEDAIHEFFGKQVDRDISTPDDSDGIDYRQAFG